ncbi:helix-turn-helix domain-containing protein [Tsukamurella sp. 1534]|uniref:helix-turn-helix domain-containing protein n=1 Tax=Tsukamurella sp. 1534 TaxID=1151061 RepID=UPI000312F56F|nr:XRE family transcriptional regulator [Tsukamurella sp. 1534]
MSSVPILAIAAGIQRERARVGWTMAELARRAGVAKSTLSQLEAGTGNPSIETLWALANALEVPFAQLLGGGTMEVKIVRAGEGATVPSDSADYAATLLTASPPGVRRDVYRIDAAPGSRRESTAHASGTVEHLLLCSGSALVGPADAPVTLSPGDFISYAGDAPHVFEALEPGTRAVQISEQH